MYVCVCNGVTEDDIRHAAEAGCGGITELTMRTGCGACCGSCLPLASEILETLRAEATTTPHGNVVELPRISHAA